MIDIKAYLVNQVNNLIVFTVTGQTNEVDNSILNLVNQGIELNCDLKLTDTRLISEKQRKFIFAMIGEICLQDYGERTYYKDFKYQELKQAFKLACEMKDFSLSSCSMHLANQFINYIIGYMLMHDYNVHKWIVDFEHRFTEQHLYIMLLKGQCFITGRTDNIHLHHYDAVGMGGDRTNYKSHVGKRVMLLHAVEHQLEHSQYDYMLNKSYIDIEALPRCDVKLAKQIANGTYKQYLNRLYKKA